MQAGPDAPSPPAGPDREAVPSRAHRAGQVPAAVVSAAVAAASRLNAEAVQPPFVLAPLSDEEAAAALARAAAAPPPAPVRADTEQALLRAYAAGDEAAFARLYDRHERATWRFIRHRLGPAHEAATEDVMQETWVSVARAAARYEPAARFTTWLFTLARSRVIDHLRAQAPPGVSIDATPEGDDEGPGLGDRLPGDPAHEPAVRVESREQARALLAALDELPPPQREAFVLQAEGGLSLEQIAEVTGVGVETAKTRLRYARARLRARLAPWRPA